MQDGTDIQTNFKKVCRDDDVRLVVSVLLKEVKGRNKIVIRCKNHFLIAGKTATLKIRQFINQHKIFIMLYLIGYQFISAEVIRLYLGNGSYRTVQLNKNSGRVYWRYKINSLTKIKHPGIYLGRCLETRKDYVIHNHIEMGNAFIDTMQGFSCGRQVFTTTACTNSPTQVLQKALSSVLRRESYHPVNFNCQTFTNSACYNRRKSEDAEKWKAIGLGALIFGGFVALARSA